MSHHSDKPLDFRPEDYEAVNPITKSISQKLLNNLKLGATGKFPEGKITPEDEGEIKLLIQIHKGNIMMNFGKKIQWIGFNPDQALQIADLLIKFARRIKTEIPKDGNDPK